MKTTVTLLFIIIYYTSTSCFAQGTDTTKLNDFGRIVLNTYVSEQLKIPAEAKSLLQTKLSQIATNSGMGGNAIEPRFIITASVNVGTKEIISGPPQMVAQNVDVTIFIGDAIENIKYSSTTVSLKGVGTNENKAFIDALKKINIKNADILTCIETGKNKIISYYKTQCDFIIKDAIALKNQEKYDEAIYKLSVVPEACKECYFKCKDTLAAIYQKKIDVECTQKLTEAKSIWAGSSDKAGADKAGNVISEINPLAACQLDVQKFIAQIQSKLTADEKKAWNFKMKQYDDNVNKEKLYYKVALEYAKNQPKAITYNNIYWW